MSDKFINNDEKIVDNGSNAFSINGTVVIPEGTSWVAFFDEMALWLESKGAYFLGSTNKVVRDVEDDTTGLADEDM